MGIYQPAYWQSDGWGMSRRETQGGTYYPYLPDRLEGLNLHLGATAASAVSKAEESIRALNHHCSHLTDTEPLARLILRSEALASSRIEGLEMGAGKLLEHEALEELGVHQRLDSTETSVLSNIAAMQTPSPTRPAYPNSRWIPCVPSIDGCSPAPASRPTEVSCATSRTGSEATTSTPSEPPTCRPNLSTSSH